LLEISKDILRKRVIEVVGYDEGTCGEAEGTRSPDGFDRPNFCNRPILVRDNERLTLNHAMQKALGIPLDFFHADVHDQGECNK